MFTFTTSSFITILIGSLAGSVLLICLIDKIRRKTLLVVLFLILAGGFAITAATLNVAEFIPGKHWLTVVLYSLSQFLFNFGRFSCYADPFCAKLIL